MIFKDIQQCTFQISSLFQNMTGLNISMIVINNTAGLSGSSIYSTNLYNCCVNELLQSIYYTSHHNEKHYYDTIFHFDSLKHDPLDISTLSNSHCICSKDLTKCIYDSNNEVVFPNIISVYPGQTLHIPMAAKDVVGNNVYSTVSLALTRTRDNSGTMSLSPFLVGPVLISYMNILVAGRPLMRVGKFREYI